MKIVETKPVQTIYFLRLNDRSNPNGNLMYITNTVEDAYDLATGFLWDEFNLTKREVIKELNDKRDYVNFYNPAKLKNVFKEVKDYENGEYSFTIARKTIEQITGIRN